MAKAALKDYFKTNNINHALAAYTDFATGSAWSIEHKMDMYDLSQKAFSSAGDLPSFERIYNNLVSSWQVFRPLGAKKCWDAGKIFNVLRKELHGYEHSSGLNLVRFDHQQRHSLMFSLNSLVGIKPNAGYPTMTVSKFLHFFNPSLFPIYDTEIVWNKVFARFGDDYRDSCNRPGLAPDSEGAAFLRNYICWASNLIAGAGPQLMESFLTWLANEVSPRRFAKLDPNYLRTLYATAFEFVAIGAAVVESA